MDFGPIRWVAKTTNGIKQINSATPTAGIWHHIATTYDGSMMKLYINGEKTSEIAQSGTIVDSAQDHLFIAKRDGDRWKGAIDEVKIYNRALSAEEVRAHNEGGSTNQPPVADPNNPYTDMEGVPILFKGNGSYDPDGTIVSYLWTFGDGNNATGVTPTHTYTQNGIYTVTLTVTDNDGVTNTSATTATIADTEPVADFTATPTSGLRPLTAAFTDASTSHDGIEAWNWDFDSDGETDSTVQNPAHVYAEEGVYTVCLTVTESDGDSDTMTKADYIIVTEVNQNVYIGLEAEAADIITSDFEIVNDTPAVGGNMYIQIPEGVGFRANDGEATYTISIDSSGDYIIWGKKIAATDNDNSFFVQIDDGTSHLFTTALSDDWQWDAVNHWGSGEEFNPEIDPVVFPLSAGEHTLRILQREDGAKLDKLLITNDTSYVPAENEAPNTPAEPSPYDSATDVCVNRCGFELDRRRSRR